MLDIAPSLDWISAKLLTDASQLDTDQIWKIAKGGDIIYKINTWQPVELQGSYSSTIQLRPCVPSPACRERFTALGLACPHLVPYISCNPTKAAQGHNCWGPPPEQAEKLLIDLTKHFPSEINVQPAHGLVDISRLDLATMIDFQTNANANQWLETIARQSRSYSGRAITAGKTVYWQKGSRRWQLKAYNKFEELLVKGHGPADPALMKKCREATEGLIRLELQLRTLELERVSQPFSHDLIWTYMERINVNTMKRFDNWEATGLKGRALDKVKLWLAGEDIREGTTKTTYYRLRREIKKATNDRVDISLPPETGKDIFPLTDFDLTYLKAHVVPCRMSLAHTLWQPGKPWTYDNTYRSNN